jgi:hypothetical protein
VKGKRIVRYLKFDKNKLINELRGIKILVTWKKSGVGFEV